MKDKKIAESTEQELLEEAKRKKSKEITHALLIGCIIGIIIYGVAKSNLGFFSIIPIYFAYKVFRS